MGAAADFAARAAAVRRQLAAEQRVASLLAALRDEEQCAAAQLQVAPPPLPLSNPALALGVSSGAAPSLALLLMSQLRSRKYHHSGHHGNPEDNGL